MPRQETVAPVTPLVAVPVLSTAFGAISGTTIGRPVALAGFGLAWGAAAVLVAPRTARRGELSAGWANAPVHVMVPLAFMVLGGSLLGHVVGPDPAAFLALLGRPGYGAFFYAFHGPFEWLLVPWALMVNWHHPLRRRVLVGTAVVFYLGRCASALYFAPLALRWAADPAEAVAQPDRVAFWIHADLVRLVLQDALVAVLLLAVALHRRLRL